MNYLLDTHYMLWAVADSKKLSKKIRDIIIDPDHRIIVSTISFWEVSLKVSLRKLEIEGFSPENLPAACLQMGFEIERLSPGDSSSYHRLKAAHHRDPFDRMLIWQAMCNNYIFISTDRDVRKYASEGLKLVA